MSVSERVASISTVAGTGEPGAAGDGGAALAACLNEPKSVAIDADGHLFIADSENHLIRRVDRLTGLITIVAGTLIEESAEPVRPASLGGDPAPQEEDPLVDPSSAGQQDYTQTADLSGTVRFVAGNQDARVRFSGDGGPATRATLHFPSAVAIDEAGNLYIADTMNHRIRKVDASTGVINTIAGTGQARFSGDGGPALAAGLNEPAALVVRRQSLYIADQSNHRIRVLDLTSGIIRTIAGTGRATYDGDGGAATETSLAGPSGLALGQNEELYIADTFNGRVRLIDLRTGVIQTIAGDGRDYRLQEGDESPSLARPYGLAVDHLGNLWLTDSDNHLLREWDRARNLAVRVVGTGRASFGGDGGDPRQASLNYPFGVAVDREGAVYIADTFNHRVRKLTW